MMRKKYLLWESIELIELELAISIDAISGKSRVRVAQ